jgi:FtsP/CotA-like multicopper oxidase with cupredoxin domain
MSGGHFFLPWNASKARLREAENARKRRQEIVKAFSQGSVSRRELFKWGLITGAGLVAPIHGLSPFVKSAYADVGSGIPTGAPPSPGTVGLEFTQPLLMFEQLERKPYSTPDPVTRKPLFALNPVPTADANQTQIPVDPLLVGGRTGLTGPIEGRPPGPDWTHQRWDDPAFQPQVAVEVSQEGSDPVNSPIKFHPALAAQNPNSVWTFNGTIPPKLLLGRYGEPVLFRHWNKLPPNVTQNNGFGRNTITTHEHNGHHGAENDGFTGAFFFPNQFYDYHWPIVLAGHDSINTNAADKMAAAPDDYFGRIANNKVPGDWRETMSTHWFHDHMFGFTSQNVYKGNAAMFNIYSALDRGNESINDGVNLRLPSGTAKSWGNLDYDINLMLSDKAWDQDQQLYFDIFNFDGFLGDAMTVNLAYKPYFDVEPRRYRFRMLNGSVARFFKVALSDGTPMVQIGNDGNLMPHPVTQTQLDQLGIGERYDIVIDFSHYKPGQKVWMVNLCEHQDGKGPKGDLSLAQALSGNSSDPCVGKFLEFRIVLPLQGKDQSLDFSKAKDTDITLIPNPDLSNIPVSRERTFEFGRSDGSDAAPWTIKTDGGQGFAADVNRVAAVPRLGTREIWHLKNGGGGWDHPVHVHFEEAQLLARNGSLSNVSPWERGRKDVYRLGPGGSVTISLQFREFAGMFMEHCHNTTHEDRAMLLRYEVGQGLKPMATPVPTPTGVNYIDPKDVVVLPGAF